jgi:hypothetical protein
MRSIFPTQHIARVLNDGVLKSATRTQKGLPVFTRPANGCKYAIVIEIRTSRHQPNRMVIGEGVLIELWRRDPVSADIKRERFCGQLYGGRDGLMRNSISTVIANQGDTNHLRHDYVLSGKKGGYSKVILLSKRLKPVFVLFSFKRIARSAAFLSGKECALSLFYSSDASCANVYFFCSFN